MPNPSLAVQSYNETFEIPWNFSTSLIKKSRYDCNICIYGCSPTRNKYEGKFKISFLHSI